VLAVCSEAGWVGGGKKVERPGLNARLLHRDQSLRGCGATSSGARGTMDASGSRGQLAELLGRGRCLERVTPSDGGYLADGGAVEDVEYGGWEVCCTC